MPQDIDEQLALAKLTATLEALDVHRDGPPAGLLPGRRRFAVNAVRHGVTGLKMLLSEDEFPAYMALGRDVMFELQPATVRDVQLAQQIVDNIWRRNRYSALENNMMMIGLVKRSRFRGDPASREILSQVLAYEADCSGPNAFDKLSRHELRLADLGDRLEAAFDRRRRRPGPAFDPETNAAYRWYKAMAVIGEALLQARRELDAVRPRALDQTQ